MDRRGTHPTRYPYFQEIQTAHLLACEYIRVYSILNHLLIMQFVTPAPANEALKQEFQEFRPTWEFADYDCIIEYTFRDMEIVKKAMSDPDWVEGVLKGQEEWVDVQKALVSVGYCTPYLLSNGDVVNMSN
jgi:hypothetical protein